MDKYNNEYYQYSLAALKNVWEKVMGLKGDNSEYLISLASKIADSMGTEKGVFFLKSIYDKGGFDINTNIAYLASNSSASGVNVASLPTQTARMAIAVVGILPILVIYPFFQKYFAKGITMGAVKG